MVAGAVPIALSADLSAVVLRERCLFHRALIRLREYGLRVYGFGERKTSTSFVHACNRFALIEDLSPPAPGRPPPHRLSCRTDTSGQTLDLPWLIVMPRHPCTRDPCHAELTEYPAIRATPIGRLCPSFKLFRESQILTRTRDALPCTKMRAGNNAHACPDQSVSICVNVSPILRWADRRTHGVRFTLEMQSLTHPPRRHPQAATDSNDRHLTGPRHCVDSRPTDTEKPCRVIDRDRRLDQQTPENVLHTCRPLDTVQHGDAAFVNYSAKPQIRTSPQRPGKQQPTKGSGPGRRGCR